MSTKKRRYAATVISLFLLAIPCMGQDLPVEIDSLAWICGCWQGSTGNVRYEEHWTRPASGHLLGVGRTYRDDRIVSQETMRVEKTESGALQLVARPSGQTETGFLLVAYEPRRVVFLNDKHDFPQRVIYRTDGQNQLTGSIEGIEAGRLRTIEFPMTRVGCE